MFQSVFPYYRPPTEEEIQSIFEAGTIALDANILLNFYRYSKPTSDDFFKLYKNEKISSRLWLPFQAAREFMRNLPSVKAQKQLEVHNLSKGFEEVKTTALKNLADLTEHLGRGQEEEHPHLNIKGVKNDLTKAFEDVAAKHFKLDKQDKIVAEEKILEKLNDLLADKIGNEILGDELKELIEEGKKRYELKIPPGFEDSKKKSEGERDPYGDWIIWNELIKRAKELNHGIIFVSDDLKRDWLWETSGQKHGPRYELVKEMLELTGQRFHVYSNASFYTYAQTFIKGKLRKASVQEATENISPLGNDAEQNGQITMSSRNRLIDQYQHDMAYLQRREARAQQLLLELYARRYDEQGQGISSDVTDRQIKYNLIKIARIKRDLSELEKKLMTQISRLHRQRLISEEPDDSPDV